MVEQLAGLLGSASLYLSATWLPLHLSRRSIGALPAEWRDHPELRERYDAALRTRLSDLPSQRLLVWVGGFAGAFAVLTATDFSLGFQLAYVGALSLLGAAGEQAAIKAESRRAVAAHGLTMPTRLGAWRVRRLGAVACWFLVYAGGLGMACFAGCVLANAIVGI